MSDGVPSPRMMTPKAAAVCSVVRSRRSAISRSAVWRAAVTPEKYRQWPILRYAFGSEIEFPGLPDEPGSEELVGFLLHEAEPGRLIDSAGSE